MTISREVYGTNVSRADVSDPNDLLAVVATWPEVWRDHFAACEKNMTIESTPARALKDTPP